MTNNGNTRSGLRDAGSSLTYLLIGGGIGATLALLFAPKSGQELRQDISEGARYGLETANEKVTQFREVAGEKVSEFKDTASSYYQKAQGRVGELYNVARKSVNDGTSEAKALASKAADETETMLNDAIEPQSGQKEAPMFETGKGPFEQRNAKTAI